MIKSNINVAYCGVEGAFAYIAAGKIFESCNRVSHIDFKSAYDSVLKGDCDVVVLPIENSYAGEVGQTIDLIFSGNLYINGIYELEIRQNLLGLKNSTVDDIKTVISHPQAISQCYEYIKCNGFEIKEESNTAVAASVVAKRHDKTLGAIASAETAELYGLKILKENINESNENTTRFAVLSKDRLCSAEMSNTVLMFAVKNEVGSLAKAINIIGDYGYNMTALRSRPMRKRSWQYYFYVEIDGITDCDNGQKMVCELNKVCDELKVVGVFKPHALI